MAHLQSQMKGSFYPLLPEHLPALLLPHVSGLSPLYAILGHHGRRGNLRVASARRAISQRHSNCTRFLRFL
jgi:hypothetical protein